MSAVLLSSYIAQMRSVVEAKEPAENWRVQFGKLADLAERTCERMADRSEPDLFSFPSPDTGDER